MIIIAGLFLLLAAVMAFIVHVDHSDELNDLDEALGIAVLDGRISADDAAVYLQYAFYCQQKGIDRLLWSEVFGRDE